MLSVRWLEASSLTYSFLKSVFSLEVLISLLASVGRMNQTCTRREIHRTRETSLWFQEQLKNWNFSYNFKNKFEKFQKTMAQFIWWQKLKISGALSYKSFYQKKSLFYNGTKKQENITAGPQFLFSAISINL